MAAPWAALTRPRHGLGPQCVLGRILTWPLWHLSTWCNAGVPALFALPQKAGGEEEDQGDDSKEEGRCAMYLIRNAELCRLVVIKPHELDSRSFSLRFRQGRMLAAWSPQTFDSLSTWLTHVTGQEGLTDRHSFFASVRRDARLRVETLTVRLQHSQNFVYMCMPHLLSARLRVSCIIVDAGASDSIWRPLDRHMGGFCSCRRSWEKLPSASPCF